MVNRRPHSSDIHFPGHRDEHVAWFVADLDGQPVVTHGLLIALPRPRRRIVLRELHLVRDPVSAATARPTS